MLDLESQNIQNQKINELEKVEELKKIFPEIFEDGKLNIEKFKNILFDIKDEKTEHYSFNWNGKQDCYKIIKQKSNLTLKVDDDKTIPDGNNVFIEGDNLEVLKLLQTSYHKKIKMIYIDPPYNKDKDFVYSDTWGDTITNYLIQTDQLREEGYTSTKTSSTGRRHTNWLNMIYPRLWLSRNLLKDDGVIFVSIDDDEVHNLRKVMDEIYGEENFIECITWNKRIPKNDKGIGNIHEYVLIYVKNIDSINHEFLMKKEGLDDIYSLVADLKKKKVPFNEAEIELKKLYKKNAYDRGITLYNAFDKNYKLWGKINMSWPNANTFGPTYEVLHPITKKPVKIPDRGWRWKKETFEQEALIKNGAYTDIQELNDGSYLCGKIWFSSKETVQPSSITYLDDVNDFLFRSIVSFKSDGGIELEKIFDGKSYFSYPKPTNLIKALISSVKTAENDIILDFFAGSGTTAHSVMELNQEDNGNRKYILVQLPEATEQNNEAYKAGYTKISDITKERIKRVITKLDYKDGFKSYRLDSSNFQVFKELKKRSNDSFEDIVKMLKMSVFNKNIFAQNAKELDISYEVGLKNGFSLSAKNEIIKNEKYNFIKLYEENREFYFCFADKIELDIAEFIPKNAKLICFDKALDDSTKMNLKDKIDLETL